MSRKLKEQEFGKLEEGSLNAAVNDLEQPIG